MTDREIMDQALDALEKINKLSIGENAICLPAEIDTAMDALRERLAQPEQRPVPPPWWPAVENILNEYGLQAIDFVDDFKKALAQPEQKPLSEEEIQTYRHMIDWTAEWSYINFARAIEQAHGIKGKA